MRKRGTSATEGQWQEPDHSLCAVCGKLKACCIPELNQWLSIPPVRFKQINSLNGPIPARVISPLVFYYYLDIPSVAHFTKICPWEDSFFKFTFSPPHHTHPVFLILNVVKRGELKGIKWQMWQLIWPMNHGGLGKAARATALIYSSHWPPHWPPNTIINP